MPNRTDILQDKFEIDPNKTDKELEEEFRAWFKAQKLLRGIPEQMHNLDYPIGSN